MFWAYKGPLESGPMANFPKRSMKPVAGFAWFGVDCVVPDAGPSAPKYIVNDWCEATPMQKSLLVQEAVTVGGFAFGFVPFTM